VRQREGLTEFILGRWNTAHTPRPHRLWDMHRRYTSGGMSKSEQSGLHEGVCRDAVVLRTGDHARLCKVHAWSVQDDGAAELTCSADYGNQHVVRQVHPGRVAGGKPIYKVPECVLSPCASTD